MKILSQYQCEICCEIYTKEEKAITCERKGVEQPLAKIGDVVEMITRLVDKPHTYQKLRIAGIREIGHELEYSFEHMHGVPYHLSVYSNKGFLNNIRIAK